jgi:glutamate mutase epsilon subunit
MRAGSGKQPVAAFGLEGCRLRASSAYLAHRENRPLHTKGRLLLLLPFLLLVSLLAPAPPARAQAARGRTRSPHGPLAIACENCHTSTSWNPIRPAPDFNHTETPFPLRGMHVSVSCRNCHIKLVFSDVGTKCADCHADLHRRQFGGKCDSCHTVRGWRVSLGSIQQHENRFPLMGAHQAVECDSCHRSAASGQFVGLSTECASCHMNDYLNTNVPDHEAANLPIKCDECHQFDSWRGVRFDHVRYTGFALEGAHGRLECAHCHSAGFAGTSANCFSCHANDFAGTTDPAHEKAGFPHDCSACHNTLTWVGATFDHFARTKFALTGAHSQLRCDQCHVAGRYAGTPQDCVGCHMSTYEATRDPDHKKAKFPTDCTNCHSTERWQGAQFDHSLARFPLTGAHASQTCSACHTGGAFSEASSACASCHMTAFTNARNPNHSSAGFPQDCSLCHNTTQWKGAKFDHNTATKFQLTGSHVSVACTSCHKNNVFQGTSNTCASCHLTDFNKTTNPNHAAADLPQDCTLCHTTAQWKGAKFDHGQTKFALTGAHTSLDCQRCHSSGKFAGLSTACSSCHLTDYNNTKNPNHAAAGFPQDCTLCHTTARWQGAKFDHGQTKFALTGAHTSLDCQRCHSSGKFAGLSTACSSCHLTDYNNTKNPNHAAAGFPQDCTLCHTTARWQGAKFDHSRTKLPLTGAHTALDCQRCHAAGQFAGLNAACSSCHLTDFNNTTNPNHAAAGFPQDCTLCHTTARWQGAKFDHSRTKFPLTGAHTALDCQRCHAAGQFAGLNAACSACHLPDFNNTRNPNHAAAGFPQDCSLCHTTTSWAGATFNHSTATKFPLTGAHTSVQCGTCHKNNVYAGLSTTCVSCHLTNYNGTTNPNHAAAGFPQDCSVCHTTTSWAGATLNHSAATKFPLTGAHTSVQCGTCHKNNVYAGLSTACVSCHLTNYNATTNPNHVAAGFPQDCSLCHTTTQWKGAVFDHSRTGFILTGAHLSASCIQCHANNRFAGTPTQCSGCHLANYNSTTNPNHAAAGFPQDCSVCHTTSSWAGATFNHNTATKFPLTGAHTSVQCGTCHKNNVYAGLSTACVSCHLANYNNTTNPNHAAAGFPQDCSICHTTSGWAGATFNHSQTPFPLTGAHLNVQCVNCHVGGQYSGTPTDCYSCHQKEYTSTTNPNHTAAGFPHDCSVCHTTTTWTGATFNHTRFPIYSGSHQGRWTTCGDCHTNSSNYSVFSCLNCHAHDKTQMDQHHAGIRDYVYNSANCYACHPTGRGD